MQGAESTSEVSLLSRRCCDPGLGRTSSADFVHFRSPPLRPSRKTRVVSTSKVCSPIACTPVQSPVRICARSSPHNLVVGSAIESAAGMVDLTFSAVPCSLRQAKLRARSGQGSRPSTDVTSGVFTENTELPIPRPVDSVFADSQEDLHVDNVSVIGRVPPASLKDKAKWKSMANSGSGFGHKPYNLDFTTLPVLAVPTTIRTGVPDPRYVPRSLFQDNAAKDSPGPPDEGAVPSSVICNLDELGEVVGCIRDAFSSSSASGKCSCDLEYVCCLVLEEFVDEVLGLTKVRVRCLDSMVEVETFKSNLLEPSTPVDVQTQVKPQVIQLYVPPKPLFQSRVAFWPQYSTRSPILSGPNMMLHRMSAVLTL
ncbi:hypothetical protein R1sor_000607 [Riccia sorocarpa]|uniref:Uncharacterized protein n=1 Tax=Riccia sorocarpa TaxID=122646 RepID=A0ABD3GWT5_9MARC